ncbi:Crp/Fnr family transcriptional regulator [Pseudomonas sp. NPDC089918]|uniref:Crp/Fnr family transcriptional regulator n=1 Tax=Pseudomonas sp. NPDC089918 TaxID=3390654 RepID=UPI003CFCB045
MANPARWPREMATPVTNGHGNEGVVSPEWLHQIPIARRHEVAEGRPIPTIGKDGEPVIIIILEGCARSTLRGRDGREHLLGYLGPGSLIGEQMAIGRTRFDSDLVCIADSNCRVGEISPPSLIAAIRAHPDLIPALLHVISRKTATLLRDIERGAFATSAAQTAALLLKLADDNGYVHVSQARLAQFAGKTRMTISTQLRRLALRGTIAQERACIRLVDSASLEKVSDQR